MNPAYIRQTTFKLLWIDPAFDLGKWWAHKDSNLSRSVRLSARFDEAARRSLALREHHVPAEACERERARVVGEDDAKLRESAEVFEDKAFPAAKRPAD